MVTVAAIVIMSICSDNIVYVIFDLYNIIINKKFSSLWWGYFYYLPFLSCSLADFCQFIYIYILWKQESKSYIAACWPEKLAAVMVEPSLLNIGKCWSSVYSH